MNFQQVREAIEALVQGLPALFSNVAIEFHFFDGYTPIGDWSQPERMGMIVTGDQLGCRSGVYFFGSPEGEIYYFGKATKNNLHHRVWGHLKTPATMADGKRTFPKHRFAGASAHEQTAHILSGTARLGVITVSDPDLSSLLEVYLQTLCVKKFGGLPAFNKQIG